MITPTMDTRPLVPADQPFLWIALYHAIYTAPGEPAPPPSILCFPPIERYAADWGRPGDLGRLAELPDHTPIAACWLRLWKVPNCGYGYVDDHTPELPLAVLPPYRSQGIGTRLLAETLADAAPRFPAISLSVTTTNPALRLYARHGFRPLSDQDGTTLMLWQR